MPPHAGWGLGLDRLVMNLLGLNNVRENTVRHLNEFTSIDMEAAFIDDKKAMEYLEEAISYAVNRTVDLMQSRLEKNGYNVKKLETPYMSN